MRYVRAATLAVLGALGALPAISAGAPSWAETPQWNTSYNNGLVPDAAATFQITGPTGAYSPASGGFRYCPGDGLLVSQVTASYRRQHAVARNSAYVRVGGGQGPAGASWQRADNSSGYTAGTWYSTGAVDVTPEGCAFGGVEISGSGNVAGTPRWNVNLQGVVLQDGVAPSVSGLAVPGGWQTGPFSVMWSSSDNGDYAGAPWGDTGARIAGGDDANLGPEVPGGHSVVLDPSGLADGPHSVAAYRAAGGWPTAWTPEATVHTDQNPPAASGFSHGLDTTGVLHFGWVVNDGAGAGVAQSWVEASSDNVTWQDLGAPHGGNAATVSVSVGQAATGLGDGLYWWRVASEDNAGNAGESAPAGQFRIDLTEPDVSAVESTLVAGDDTRRRIRFTADDPGGIGFVGAPAFTIETRADAGDPWVERHRGATVAGVNTAIVDTHAMDVGRYDVRLSVRDAAGNEAVTEFAAGAAEAIVVDREPPTVADTSIRYLNFPGARVSWQAGDPHDGVGMNATGPANVRIEVEDPGGSGVWTTLHHAAHADGAGSASIALDTIAPGRHRGRISVTDQLGHITTIIFAFDVIRDEAAPEVSAITVSPIEADLADLTFTVSDGPDGVGIDPNRRLTVECNTTGTWFDAIDLNASTSTEVGADGTYTRQIPLTVCPTGESTPTQGVRLRVRDRSGNTREVVAGGGAYAHYPRGAFLVDKLMPDVTDTQVEALADGTGRARFRFRITEPHPSLLYLPGDRSEIRVEDTRVSPSVWRLVESVPAQDGPVDVTVPIGVVTDQQLSRWQVVVADRMGNTRTWTSPPAALRVDRTGPKVTNTVIAVPGVPGGGGLATGDVTVQMEVSDDAPTGAGTSPEPHARFQARINGTWRTLAEGAASDAHLTLVGSTLGQPDGLYHTRLVVDDLLHNTRSNATGSLVVDHTAPQVDDLTAALLAGQRLEVAFTLSDPGVGLPDGHEVVIDGEAPDGSWRQLDRFPAQQGAHRRIVDGGGLREGTPLVRVHAWDRGGRERVAVARASVDRTPPSIGRIIASYPAPGQAQVCAVVAAGAGTSVTGDLVAERRVGDDWTAAARRAASEGRVCLDLDISGWGDGTHTLRLTLQDQAANQAVAFTTIARDATPPHITGLQVGAQGTTATVTFTATDSGSGLDPDRAVVYLTPTAGQQPIGPWVDVWHQPLATGDEQQAVLDLAHHRGATLALKVSVSDRAGNTAEAVTHLDLSATGPQARSARVLRLRPLPNLKDLNQYDVPDPAAPGGVGFRAPERGEVIAGVQVVDQSGRLVEDESVSTRLGAVAFDLESGAGGAVTVTVASFGADQIAFALPATGAEARAAVGGKDASRHISQQAKAPAARPPAKRAPGTTPPPKPPPPKSGPAKRGPAKTAPARTPAKKGPVRRTPGAKKPVRNPPARRVPVKRPPARRAPQKKASGRRVTVPVKTVDDKVTPPCTSAVFETNGIALLTHLDGGQFSVDVIQKVDRYRSATWSLYLEGQRAPVAQRAAAAIETVKLKTSATPGAPRIRFSVVGRGKSVAWAATGPMLECRTGGGIGENARQPGLAYGKVGEQVPAKVWANDYALAAWLRPVMRYDSDESFTLVSASIATDAYLPLRSAPEGYVLPPVSNGLVHNGSVIESSDATSATRSGFWCNSGARVRGPGGARRALSLRSLEGPGYPTSNGEPASEADYLVFDEGTLQEVSHRYSECPAMYARVWRDPSGMRVVQYWFFYYDNPKFRFQVTGAHHGDWEMIQVHLTKDRRVLSAAYAQHHGGEMRDWGKVEVVRDASGIHPVVYVALDSHASYFEAGRKSLVCGASDYADGTRLGRGTVDGMSYPTLLVSSRRPKWFQWPGKWGQSSQSPEGPGGQGEKWDDPWGWAVTSANREAPSCVQVLKGAVAGPTVSVSAQARPNALAVQTAVREVTGAVAGTATVHYADSRAPCTTVSVASTEGLSIALVDTDAGRRPSYVMVRYFGGHGNLIGSVAAPAP